MLTFEALKKNEAVKVYLQKADESLSALGYTEHSFAHVGKVAQDAADILGALDFSLRDRELVQIAAYLHDIGNLVNRIEHSQSGAIMAFRILDRLGMAPEELAVVVSAIGNHDEGTGVPVNAIAAALILADKSDVRRTRVRNQDPATFDIHDRVNYSAMSSHLQIDRTRKTIVLNIAIDTGISSVMEYFEIFLERMILCRKAAQTLGLTFGLFINGQQML